MTLDKALTWFINGWIGVAVIINLMGMAGLMIAAPTFWAGIGRIQEIYSPFNVANFLFEMILIAPALGAIAWRERRRARSLSDPTR